MTVRHHPDEALLLAYAAGSLEPATSLILATHLSFCGQCRAAVALGEAVGGALLEDQPALAMTERARADVMARLDDPFSTLPATLSRDGTPAPLRAFLGRDLSELRWRRMGPRLGYVTLYRRGRLAMRLLRGAPGTDVGMHTHRGAEFTLVLRGGYSDETGRYGPGDFQTAAGDLSHNPVADPGEDCVNLTVTQGGLRFRKTVQNIVATLFGF